MADEHDGQGPRLPASIAAAWGLRERPRKGPRRELSLEQIVAAGIAVARAEGLAAVAMSRVAAAVGASTMALYRYVAAKDELLALMVDAAYGPPPAAPPDDDWRAGLARWAWAERAALLRDPWILGVPISGPPTTPNAVGWMELGLACQRGLPFTETEKLSTILLVTSYTRSEALLGAQVRAAFQAAGVSSDEAMSSYGRLLAQLTDPVRFPALRAVIAAGSFDEPDDPDAEFTFGLERILDGIAALARRRAAAEWHTDESAPTMREGAAEP